MTISSSLNAGVAGLAANASRLATISDNIANSATIGYKRAVSSFQSLVLSDGGGTYSAGGVRITNSREVDGAGSLVGTSNATDLVVNGRGFLPIASQTEINAGNANLQMDLVRTGAFRTDSSGYLTTPTGQVLMGWPVDGATGAIPTYQRDSSTALEPVRIPVNEFAGEPTTEVRLNINLPGQETEYDASGDVIEMTIDYYDNIGKAEALNFYFTPTIPGIESSNNWTIEIMDSAQNNAVIGEYTLQFDDSQGLGGRILSVTDVSGGAYDPATGELSITTDSGPISVFIGEIGKTGGISQLAGDFATIQIDRNGSQVGNRISTEIDPNGFVYASYDVGITRLLYQVPIVVVPNPNGLTTMDNQTYRPNNTSGPFFLWDAGAGPAGDVTPFALEQSTAEVARELTDLIQTQRAYSSNAKVIQTVDEMLQETTNIKR